MISLIHHIFTRYAGQLVRPNSEDAVPASWFNAANVKPLVCWSRVIFKHLTNKRRESLSNNNLKAPSCVNILFIKIETRVMISRVIVMTVDIGHLRSVGTSTPSAHPPPCQPQPPSHNGCSSSNQPLWEGGDGSPGLCLWEESQHRGKIVGSIFSSSNNECLQVKKVD